MLDETEIVQGIPDEIPHAYGGAKRDAVDLGFLGLQEDGNIEIPHKKPRGGDLSEEKKQENREKNSRRVRCKNAFAGVK